MASKLTPFAFDEHESLLAVWISSLIEKPHIILYKIHNNEPIKYFNIKTDSQSTCQELSFSPKNHLLIACMYNGTIDFWDLDKKERLKILNIKDSSFASTLLFACNPQENQFICCSQESLLQRGCMKTFEIEAIIRSRSLKEEGCNEYYAIRGLFF